MAREAAAPKVYDSFNAWLDKQPRGALAHLLRSTRLAPQTVDRLRKRLPVMPATATRISRYTKGQVPVKNIPQYRSGLDQYAA